MASASLSLRDLEDQAQHDKILPIKVRTMMCTIAVASLGDTLYVCMCATSSSSSSSSSRRW